MRGDAGFPVRLRFAEHGKVRWIGHRDVARAFERAFRVVALPLAFSRGYSPHPKISFGHALSVGYESDAEYLDVEMASEIDLDSLGPALSEALPEGIDVTGVAPLVDRAPALQEAVTAQTWSVRVVAVEPTEHLEPSAFAAVVDTALALPALPTTRRRKGREVVEDVRPVVRRLDVVGAGDPGVLVTMELSTRPRSAKPSDVLAAISGAVEALDEVGGVTEGAVLRTEQWIERDGARLEPMHADTRPREPEARAS